MNAKHLPLLFASILLTACGSVVTDGGGSSGNPPVDTTTSGGNPTGGASEEQPVAAVALTRAQLDVLWEEYWDANPTPTGSTSGSGGGSDLDPNDLFLRLSDLGVTCGSPTVDLSCGGHYELSLALPPALQQVGVYDLEDPQLVAYSMMSETGELNSADPQDCPWGGGSLGSGTLEILSIDETAVHFKVTLTNGLWDANPSGEYNALRCPAAE